MRWRTAGPTAAATGRKGPIALGHRRLAIIDLSAAANQPMWSADGSLGIVFNGEIYNYRELARALAAAGCHAAPPRTPR